ncbi:hypothetical protein PHYPSEUDO_015428 [Phytophthora pseudosyringae]|uniref:Uncharacterized protein n=1 Tax=Phytophthora pseudosyringae TaxID=221518 RepID=A0A8T1W3N1_9STRA|nr:hypothetical protein PHYPSEUDO_015428 [Phytophthora pseudosyringae]
MATLHVMPLVSCSCSCGLHDALRRPDATTPSLGEPIRPHGTESEAACAEQLDGEDEDEEHILAVSSPRNERYSDEDFEDVDAMEREEAEAVVATLQLQVRALRKYKSNYELLCGQLSELNAQIGLQLQRHEADVAALQASIADLQTDKIALEAQASEAHEALAVQRDALRQDREYSEHVHRQLSTAAELLKATEKRLEQQEDQFAAEIEKLQSQLAVEDDDRVKEYQAIVRRLEDELEALRARQVTAKEQEAIRRRREKSKHKKELMDRTANLQAVSDELEAQRSVLRATKKQLAQVQTDNDALRKQVANVKRDGTHLSDIIDSQRSEHELFADELMQAKTAKKQLAKRVEVLSQEAEQLQSELADAKEESVFRKNELENCRNELKGLRTELRQTSQALDEVQCSNDKLVKQIESLQKGESANVKMEEQEQRAARERKYRKELVRLRELLADNQQRATASSKDVQKLRRELLSVQKLLHGCTEERAAGREPIDQWAAVMRNSIKDSALKNTIMEQVRIFSA